VSALEVATQIIGGIIFLGWIASMYVWVRRGGPIPRWLHAIALAAFVIGIALGTGLVVLSGFPIWTAVACGSGFPAGIYTGWLWMFGPEWAEKGKAS
jgi:hypothetical protein